MEVRRTTEGFPTRCSAIKGVDEIRLCKVPGIGVEMCEDGRNGDNDG